MNNKFDHFSIDEDDIDKQIESGEITPVELPRKASISEIIKFQFCTEIIRYKKRNKLKQKDIAQIIDVDKSEISKLFSYHLSEFSQERIIHFVEILLDNGANIDLNNTWNQIKNNSKLLQKRPSKKKRSTRFPLAR